MRIANPLGRRYRIANQIKRNQNLRPRDSQIRQDLVANPTELTGRNQKLRPFSFDKGFLDIAEHSNNDYDSKSIKSIIVFYAKL